MNKISHERLWFLPDNPSIRDRRYNNARGHWGIRRQKSTRCHHKKGKRIRGKRRRRRRFVDERFDALGLPVRWGTSERGIGRGRLQKEHYRRRERRCRKGVSKRSNSSPKFITALLAELKASLSPSLSCAVTAVDLPSDDGGRGPPLFRMFVKLLHFPGKVRSPPVPIEGGREHGSLWSRGGGEVLQP